jgi:hypothetical protein
VIKSAGKTLIKESLIHLFLGPAVIPALFKTAKSPPGMGKGQGNGLFAHDNHQVVAGFDVFS